MEDLFDSRWRVPVPAWTDHQVVARPGASGGAANVTVVVGIPIGELHGIVAFFSTAGTEITIGSARRSSHSMEYGVSLFGVTTAVSLQVTTRASLLIWIGSNVTSGTGRGWCLRGTACSRLSASPASGGMRENPKVSD